MSAENEPEREERRSALRLWLVSLALTAVLFVVAIKLMGPAPPRRIILAAGAVDGTYYRHAEAYRQALSAQGLEIEVLPTAGSVENLGLLREGKADVAFVQGGTAQPADGAKLRALASVFLEPLWIFHRNDVAVEGLRDLAGRRVAAGPVGSGTRSLVDRLLGTTGVSGDGGTRGATLLPIGGADALSAVESGEADVGIVVVAPGPAWLTRMLGSSEVSLVELPRLEAYARRLRFLEPVELPEGGIDLARDLPRRDVQLLASTATLAARADLHDALVPLLIAAAREIHGGGGLIDEPGQFPSPNRVDLPLHEDARHYFEHGLGWTYRVFPFWVASFLDRAVIFLLPLFTLLFPLLKTAPPIYRWGVRRRIYRWYRAVREIDRIAQAGATPEQRASARERLRTLEHEVSQVAIPLSYMAEFYDLRLHLDFVARRLGGA